MLPLCTAFALWAASGVLDRTMSRVIVAGITLVFISDISRIVRDANLHAFEA